MTGPSGGRALHPAGAADRSQFILVGTTMPSATQADLGQHRTDLWP